MASHDFLAIEDARAVLAAAFPNQPPILQDAAPDHAVIAAYWRQRGHQDVINHLTGLVADPTQE
jgi:hypothetical protein